MIFRGRVLIYIRSYGKHCIGLITSAFLGPYRTLGSYSYTNFVIHTHSWIHLFIFLSSCNMNDKGNSWSLSKGDGPGLWIRFMSFFYYMSGTKPNFTGTGNTIKGKEINKWVHKLWIWPLFSFSSPPRRAHSPLWRSPIGRMRTPLIRTTACSRRR